jgi:FAD-dependent urate hydroxylase
MAIGDVLVIGAGPFGLSISAHLRERGVDHTVVGRPMDTWRAHMPLGLFLKSEPYGSVISAPARGYDIATYCRRHGLDDYVGRVGPLSLERFLDYADWYTAELVPDVRDATVTRVAPCDGGFTVEFADDVPAFVRQVIIATGVLPYAHVPGELSGLPADLVTHSSVHDRLDQFRGRRVAVIGAGQSALQTAALLHEAGADVRVIARRQQLIWEERIAAEPRLLDRITRPPARLCEGWGCAFYDSPDAFRLLPESVRVNKALTVLGPKGAWWLRDRVEGVLEVMTGRHLRSAESQGSGVLLQLDGPERTSVAADHVIAGTGFRIDMSRLTFLAAEIQAGLATRAGCPLVNRAGESAVPGLYFAGAPTMVSLGPGVRFISGTHHVAAQLARSVARRARRGSGQGVPGREPPVASMTMG